MKQRVVFAFGPWKLDPVAKVLFRDGEPVHMTRKAVETLLVLVENAGRVLTKEEIMSAVWPDRVVDEANLAQNIAVVRRILAAEKGSPAHIETFPGRGYRLEGPVVTESDAYVPEASETANASAPLSTDSLPHESSPQEAELSSARSWWKWVVGGALVATGIALAIYRGAAPGTGGFTDVSRVTPITRLSGKEYQPAITRDGARIAFLYAEDAASPPQVWVQEIGGSNARAISKDGAHHSSPAWSPDGSHVAYLRIDRTATELVIASASVAGERVLARFDQPAYGYDHRMLAWSPDGKRLVVSRAIPDKPALALFLVDAQTGAATPLTDPGESVAGDVDPRFSPDGSKVSFLRLIHRTQQEIFTVPTNGGAASQLTKLGRRISSHDWSAEDGALVYACDRDGNYRLWRLRADASDGGRTSTALGVYSEFPIQISVARSSESLVYSALQQDRNVWRLNLQSLDWKRLIASSGQDASPQYSPSGEFICFRSDRSGEEQLWVSDPEGGKAVQITRGTMRPSVGRWSPDGKSIVFNSPETGDVWVAERGANSAWSARNVGVQGVHPVFSQDGNWIYAGGPSGIVRFGVSGVPVESIAPLKSEALALSRDGKYLYFVREPTDTTLWRLDLDTEQATKVLDGLVPGCTSCWALADDGVYFLGADRESFDRQILFFWDFKTSAARTVIPYPEPLWPLGSGPFSLGPGGNLLVVRVEPSNSDAMLATPFR